MKNNKYDAIIIGAGAAGLMSAIEHGKKNFKTLLIEHTNKIGEKIRISGGGRCNFTNLNIDPKSYISQNKHFMKSALSQYTQYDFIELVKKYKIDFHEKTLGQLFCDGSSKQIIDMLVSECNKYNVEIIKECIVNDINKNVEFELNTSIGVLKSNKLIIATGGLSIPKIGSSNFGYNIAKKFGLNIITTFPALVPLDTINSDFCKNLRGIAIFARVSHNKVNFSENILFTHHGLSGPAILQISSYLNNINDDNIKIDLLPQQNLQQILLDNKNNKQKLANFMSQFFPNKFIDNFDFIQQNNLPMIDLKKDILIELSHIMHNFNCQISGSQGYAKAEVTKGGIDTNELSSKNMEAKKIPGLHFIGEVVDVTGWLGGYNFQWAWSSGFISSF